jgi:hypothetical protein
MAEPKKVEHLGSALLRRIIRQNGGFNAEVARDLQQRLPGFDLDQIGNLLRDEPEARDEMYRHFLSRVVELCGGPDGPPPDHVAINKMLKPFPAESRAELLVVLRDEMPWIGDGFDAAAWKAKREADKIEAIAFFDALELLGENGEDLVYEFLNQVLVEYRRERSPGAPTLDDRLADLCASMELPQPPHGFDLYGLAETSLS